MKLSVGFKMSLIAVAAAMLIGGGSILVGYFQYNTLAQRNAQAQLAAVGRIAQTEFQTRLEHKRRATADIASDPTVVSYIAAALSTPGVDGKGVDTASIRDLIGNRARNAGFDFASVLDPGGHFLTGSGDAINNNAALSGLGFAEDALKNFAAQSRIVFLEDRVYLVSVAAMVSGQHVQAILVTGSRFGNDALGMLARRAGMDLAVAFGTGNSARIPIGSLSADGIESLQRLAKTTSPPWAMDSAPDSGHVFSATLNGQVDRLRLQPLELDAGAPATLILIDPVTHDANLMRGIALPLSAFAVGFVALVWLVLFGFWLRAARALARLCKLCEQCLLGDHALNFQVKAAPSITRIGQCLNEMALRLDRHRVPHGGLRRRATDVALPLSTQRVGSVR